MTNRGNLAIVGGVATVLALGLAGCSAGDVDQAIAQSDQTCQLPVGPVALVVGARANTPAVSGVPVLEEAVRQVITQEASISVLDAGGVPDIHVSVDFKPSAANDEARRQESEVKKRRLGSEIVQVRARAEEANPLEALSRAADAIRGHSQTGTILMMDSGLQTTGALDYTSAGTLLAEPKELAKKLSDAGRLPSLEGITVLLAGVGDTAAPQPPIDATTRATLREQWVAIAEQAGASCVDSDPTPVTGPSVSGAPSVSVVDPPKVEAVSLPAPGDSITLPRHVLRFHDNSPELVDPMAAENLLKPLVDRLNQVEYPITLTGTTATAGTEEGQKELSLARANAIKAILVDLGLAADRIETIGAGIDHPSRRTDIGKNGEVLPGPAALNRAVILTVDDPAAV